MIKRDKDEFKVIWYMFGGGNWWYCVGLRWIGVVFGRFGVVWGLSMDPDESEELCLKRTKLEM